MTQIERVQNYANLKFAEKYKSRNNGRPIYEIMVFEQPNKELEGKDGKRLQMPDFGCTATMGFYYDLQDAVDAMHENACDIHETVYNAGFILCRFPGLYDCVPKFGRIYMVYDKEKDGYFEVEEPELFEHISM